MLNALTHHFKQIHILRGKRIVTSCSDGQIRLWDVETGLELTSLPGQIEESVLVTWDHSQDRIIAIDSKVYIWKASPEKEKANRGIQ